MVSRKPGIRVNRSKRSYLRLSLPDRVGQRERKRRTLSYFALQRQLAAVQLDEFLRQREAKPRAF